MGAYCSEIPSGGEKTSIAELAPPQHSCASLDLFWCLQALQMRCEHFMCNNFHQILDDPLLQVSHAMPCHAMHVNSQPCYYYINVTLLPAVQDLNRQSLLRMLRAQSAMVSVYQQNLPCPQTWGLAR